MTSASPEERSRARLLVLGAAVLWSTGGLGIKHLPACDALTIAGLRAVVAGLVMAAVVVRLASRERLVAILRRKRVWAGATSYALMVVCFVLAAKLTTAANAILIQYTAPIYVALVSPALLGEKVTLRDALAIVATLAGMVLFFMGDLSGAGRLGNVVAIVSSFGFAGLPVLLRLEDRARRAEGLPDEPATPLATMTLGNAIAAAVCLPHTFAAPPTTLPEVAVIGALGTFQIAIPYLLYARAVRALPALESSLIASIEPILAPIWVFLSIGERPSAGALAGGAIIVAAVTFQAVQKRTPADATVTSSSTSS